MDLVFVTQFCKAVLRELYRYKYPVLIGGFVIASVALVFGMFWKESYRVSATLYADSQNIIAPLLQGQAQVTEVENQLQVVKDLLLSEKLLGELIDGELFGLAGANSASRKVTMGDLRRRVEVRQLGKQYIFIAFQDTNPDLAYYVVTKLVDMFLRVSSENKKSESRQAFVFIDKQADSYKNQLRQAEENLKQFNASNIDGSEARVLGNIENLNSAIDELKLDLEQASERVLSLKSQVSDESRYLTLKAKSEEFAERIADATSRLDDLMLVYTDSHPDVIALKEHIEALRKASETTPSDTSGVDVSGVENPVYDELRTLLAAAEVEKNTIEKRIAAMQTRLTEQRARAKRIVERDAELAELTRDYDVTKQLYEELLERKEKARLSMTLDIEGQGVTYKVQEPAQYPLFASGLRFYHIFIIGVFAAALVPVGAAVAYILFDPRIRFASTLAEELDVPVVGEIPRMLSGPALSIQRTDIRMFAMLASLLALIYLASAIGFIVYR